MTQPRDPSGRPLDPRDFARHIAAQLAATRPDGDKANKPKRPPRRKMPTDREWLGRSLSGLLVIVVCVAIGLLVARGVLWAMDAMPEDQASATVTTIITGDLPASTVTGGDSDSETGAPAADPVEEGSSTSTTSTHGTTAGSGAPIVPLIPTTTTSTPFTTTLPGVTTTTTKKPTTTTTHGPATTTTHGPATTTTSPTTTTIDDTTSTTEPPTTTTEP